MATERPSRDELEALYKTNTLEAIGKMYGVSRQAVHYWMIEYKLERRGATYKPHVPPIDLGDAIGIPTKSGDIVVVDYEDADLAEQRWLVSNGYACTTTKPHRSIHRIILSRKLGRPLNNDEVPDHKDRNPLNNRRSNLRPATTQQNVSNSRAKGGKYTKYKGVSWNKSYGKWYAYIKHNYKMRILGHFDSPDQAAETYNQAASELFGEFAALNEIQK